MNRVTRSKWFWILIAAGILALVLFVPFETTVAPEWKIRVVDESGKPVPAVPISEVWNHNVITEGGEETIVSNSEGYVTFPRRSIKANLTKRAVRKFLNVMNPHGASGPTAYILVLRPYQSEDPPYYEPGKSLATQVIVRRSAG